jgi:serine/threonine protein kinase
MEGNGGMNYIKLPPNSKRSEELDVKVIKLIGEGTYGKVYKIRMNNLEYALKVISKSNKSNINEVKIINYINEMFPECTEILLCYHDISEDKDNFYLLSELMDYDLFYFDINIIMNLKKKSRLNICFSIFYECLNGLKKLEDIGIIHRDIKPENILVKEYNNNYKFYISDFGLSCEPIDCKNIRGTDIYIDPTVYIEYITDKSYINNTAQSDIYSLSVMMYSILTGNVYLNKDELEELDEINSIIYTKIDNEEYFYDKIYCLYTTCYDRGIIVLEKYIDYLDERLKDEIDETYINGYKMIKFIIYNMKPFRKNRDTPTSALIKLEEDI